MNPLVLHDLHLSWGAELVDLNGQEAVRHYGNFRQEHAALTRAAGILDLSFRGRLCILGEDRRRFLHGQVTNDINRLQVGEGCYAALVTAKGRMISDLHAYRLADELLLDLEPGVSASVKERLEQYVIADAVEVADAAPFYGLWSVQGPKAESVLQRFRPGLPLPSKPLSFVTKVDEAGGVIYVVNQPRLGTSGFDLFVPVAGLAKVGAELRSGLAEAGGHGCGWQAFEAARIEAGIPRYGVDMDASNLPQEAGLEARAISFSKGCYIGQEVIARVRTYGQVVKLLRGLRFASELSALPVRGDKLFHAGKEVGMVTSALRSPALGAHIGLGYVRREAATAGTELVLRSAASETVAVVADLPFAQHSSTSVS